MYFKKKLLTIQKIESSRLFKMLSNKTQMIRNSGDVKVFTNRSEHSIQVSKICDEIVNKNNLMSYVDSNRLKMSALLHDIGHTPYGHAGEDAINNVFLSNNTSHYCESRPGLFKHNINSVRLVLNNFVLSKGDSILIDSILKHSSVFPKNYNFLVFSELNITKTNYIFRIFNIFSQDFIKDFSLLFDKKCICSNKCRDLSTDVQRKYCLRKDTFCFATTHTANFYLSKYLAYPYPLTIEGTILLFADEIACFETDLRDLIIYVKKYEKNLDSYIPLLNLTKTIKILRSKYRRNSLLTAIEKTLDCIFCKNDKRFIVNIDENIKIIGDKLCKNFIFEDSLLTPSINLRITSKKGCQPLFSFNKKTNDIFYSIKNSLYTDIHGLSYISKTNKNGKENLIKMIEFYTRNFNLFLQDYSKILQIDVNDYCIYLIDSISNRIEEESKINNISKLLLIKSINRSKFKFISSDSEKIKLIKNLLVREICYFVATLDEKQLFSVMKSRKITFLDISL